MTRHLAEQTHFYKNILCLDQLFDHQNAIGFGKNKRLFLILRNDDSENSHHLSMHKGPQIITFKCKGNINNYTAKIKQAGFKVRDTLMLPEHGTYYLFIEDYDGNEICLDFSIE